MQKAKILFVDDEEHIVKTLKSLFRNKYDIYTATSAMEALGIVTNDHIHVVVSDQRMPEMQGIELLREIKALSPTTMRLMLTGYSDLDAILGSINTGEIFRYIYKPWDNDEIKKTIDLAASVGLKIEASGVTVPDNDKPYMPTPVTNDAQRTGILVMDSDPQAYATIKELFEKKYRVVYAPSFERALDVLENQEIGVVVSDVFVDKKDATILVKALKAEYPEIVTVILTKFNDANMAVKLINQGQIFRYLSKPIHKAQLRASLETSVIYHNKCKSQPLLLGRHQVEHVDVSPASAPMFTTIMDRIKSLRGHIHMH